MNMTDNSTEETKTEENQATNGHGSNTIIAEKTDSREMVLKAKRRYHPNEKKYDGRASTADMLVAQIEFAGKLTPEQSKLFKKNKLIYDQEKFDALFNDIGINDVIGYKGMIYKVLSKHRQRGLSLSKRKFRNRNDEQVFTDVEDLKISIYDLDFMMNLNSAEILYKDGKPYGVSEDLEYKVKVEVFTDENGNQYVTQKGREIKPGSSDAAAATVATETEEKEKTSI